MTAIKFSPSNTARRLFKLYFQAVLLLLVLVQAGQVLTTVRAQAARESRLYFNDVIIKLGRVDILVKTGKMPLEAPPLIAAQTAQAAAKIRN